MSDIWYIFVSSINSFNQKLIKFIILSFKKIVQLGKFYSKSSTTNIEIKKIEWELNKERKKLGKYVFEKNLENTYDFSNDTDFSRKIKIISEIENFLKSKKNKN